MRAYCKLCIAVTAVFVLLAVVLNIYMIRTKDGVGGIYRVEAKRLADEIAETGSYDLAKYPHITGVFSDDDIYSSNEPYVIIEINGTLYRGRGL